MSTQPESAPGESRAAETYLRPLRDIAALVLIAAPALLLFVAVIRLIPGGDGDQFTTRAEQSFGGFINLTSIGLPLLAVLLSTLIKPEHPKAKLITTVALAQYAVMAFFGVLFGFLIGLIGYASWDVRLAFEEFLVRGAWLVLFGIAAFAVFQIWRNLYFTPRPKPVPGMYGQPSNQQFGPPPSPAQPAGQYGAPQPSYGAPQQYDQQQYDQQQYDQQQYGQPGQQHDQPGHQYDQPSQQQYGQPTWNQPDPGPPSAPYSGAPARYSAPPAAPPVAQPPGPFAPEPGHPQGAALYGTPSSGQPPFGQQPYSAPTSGAHDAPGYGAAPGYDRFPEPTQPPTQPPAGPERTQMMNPERPAPDERDPYRY